MPDLEGLRKAAFADATELVPIAASPPIVAWVRVMTPRVPAFEALASGDLALIPSSALATLAAGGVDPAAVVDALDDAGAVGALIVGRASGDAEAGLHARSLDVRLPLWQTDGDDVAAVERAIVAVLVDERAATERRAADLEARIGGLALAGVDLAAQVGVIAAELGRATAIEGPHGEVIAVHAPEDPAAAAAAAAYLGHRRQVLLRTVLPGAAGVPSGALVILGEPPATEFERLAADRLVAILAIQLVQGAAPRQPAASRRDQALPGDGPPWVALLARQLVAGEATDLEQRERLRERVARLAPTRRLRLRGDAGSLELRVIVATDAADPLGLAMADRVAELIGRPVSLSRPFERPDDRPLAEQEARAALEAAESLPATAAPRLVRADRLAAMRLVGSLHNLPDGLQNARLLLAPVLDGRPAVVADRLATLRAVLEQPGLSDAARQLGIHRNTLAYRIGRIEAAGGWRLDDPDLRIALALAVRLVQNAQDGR